MSEGSLASQDEIRWNTDTECLDEKENLRYRKGTAWFKAVDKVTVTSIQCQVLRGWGNIRKEPEWVAFKIT